MVPSRRKSRACSCETYVSSSREMPHPAARPTVTSSATSTPWPRRDSGSRTLTFVGAVPVCWRECVGAAATVVAPTGAGLGSRSSAHTARNTRRKNRYSKARKANLRIVRSDSGTTSSRSLERELGTPDLDLVAVDQCPLFDAGTVHLCAIERAEVHN